MSWDAAFPDAAERNTLDLAARPLPAPPRAPSVWAQLAAFAAAPFAGAAQGVNETLRAGYRAITAGADEVMRRQQQEVDEFTAEAIFQRRLELDEERAAVDASLRSGVDYWRPNAETATTASMVLHNFARVGTKVAGALAATRNPLAAAGMVGADEGATAYLDLRDQGVDPTTAAKVGAVSGIATAVGIALPASAPTALGKVALVAAGGPGGFMAENAIAREILRAADYDKLAEQYDPTDRVGLTVSTLLSGAVAVAAGRAKPTRAQVDAAQVSLRNQELLGRALTDAADPATAQAHLRAVDAARAAIDDGRPVDVAAAAPIDAVKAGELLTPLREALDEIDHSAIRTAIDDSLPAPSMVPARAADAALGELVQQILRDRPELLIRDGDTPDAPVTRAADLLVRTETEIAAAETEGRAYRAAVNCFLRRGA